MSRSLNKVQLIGYLGADPESRAMPSGSSVANIRMATTDSWRDRESGEARERTEWHRIAAFGKLAEIMTEYLRKGSQVYIEGSLRTRKWQDREGNERYTTEIVASQMIMLGGGGRGEGGGRGGRRQESLPDDEYDQSRDERQTGKPPAEPEFDDDIPF